MFFPMHRLTHAIRHVAKVEERTLFVSGNTFILEHTGYGQPMPH
jgi:hypothetical protein